MKGARQGLGYEAIPITNRKPIDACLNVLNYWLHAVAYSCFGLVGCYHGIFTCMNLLCHM